MYYQDPAFNNASPSETTLSAPSLYANSLYLLNVKQQLFSKPAALAY
jgi:hypothetical protein